MKIWDVIGFEEVKYTNKSRREVHGYRLNLVRDSDDESPVVGQECHQVFFSCSSCGYVPQLGDPVRLIYEPGFNNQSRLVAVEYAG